jgi:SAM-dependent methyltransferase
MADHRLYKDLSYLFPIITPAEHYADCASQWRQLLRTHLGSGKHRILEFGVGGGHNLSHLRDDFEATAVDISPDMLELSRKLNPTVRHVLGDMRSVDLGETFKAVLIHDAISYLTRVDDLRSTVATAARHLDPDGVFIMAPDYFSETFIPNRVTSFTNHVDGKTVTFLEHVWDPDPADTEIEVNMFFLIMQDGALKVEEDRHYLGLFSRQIWEKVLQEEGFKVEWVPCPYLEGDLTGWLIVARYGT